MNTYLFYDTETTGLAKMNRPHDDPSQPRVVQLAALLVDDDMNELDHINDYCIPVGFTIPDEAAAIHGTTTEKATKLGKNAWDVMLRFTKLAEQATIHVAHNIAFDRIVVRRECFEHKLAMPDRKEICTMLAMTKLCNLPGRFGKPKWPKLQEAYQWCFGKEFDKAHDALADIRACKEVFFHSVYQRPKGEARTEAPLQPITITPPDVSVQATLNAIASVA